MLFAEQTAAVFFQTAYKINGTPVPHIRSHYYAIILFVGIPSLVSLAALCWYEHDS